MRRFLALLLFLATFFYLTMIYNSQSFMLLFFVGVTLLVLLQIFNFIASDILDVELVLPKNMIRVGNDIVVELHFKGDSIPSGRVVTGLLCRSVSGRYKQKASVTGHAVSKGVEVVRYAFSGKNVGIFTIRITKIRVFDYLGILGLPKFCGRQEQQVYVIPNVYTVPMKISEKYSDMAMRIEPDASSDMDADEREQIREYVRGDSLHDIHWKLTAKKDLLMVREHQRIGSIAIHLLLKGKKMSGSEDILAFLQVAISLSRGIAATGNEHFVVWFDSSQNGFVRLPIREKSQAYEIMWQIMRFDDDDWASEPDTETYVSEYKSKFGIAKIPCLLQLDRKLSLQLGYNEIIRYKGTNLKEQLCKDKLIF